MSAASDLIASFSENVTLVRYDSDGAFVDGTYVPGDTTESTIEMSVQPLSGKDLLNLPEGQRNRRLMKGYTAEELIVGEEATGQKADRIEYNDTTFEVQTVERWRGDLDFFKVLMAEVNV